jgi:tRNA threonylcarbamoyladenosine modification (KEOPS) complex Cgi121 subunit
VIVMQLAKDFKIPLVVNLAGGYARQYEDTLQIHMNTGEALKQVFLGVESKPVYPSDKPFDVMEAA